MQEFILSDTVAGEIKKMRLQVEIAKMALEQYCKAVVNVMCPDAEGKDVSFGVDRFTLKDKEEQK